jgi:hypothetical protein
MEVFMGSPLESLLSLIEEYREMAKKYPEHEKVYTDRVANLEIIVAIDRRAQNIDSKE